MDEIQLLVRWLGPESSKFAANIRQARAENPTAGVNEIWSRLEERYGAPELIDNAMKMKLREFPSLAVKDNKKLFEFGDLLTELEAMKQNPRYKDMMSYYDTSIGIMAMIKKLPYPWREKWTSRAYDYKVRHDVAYPPLEEFSKFIRYLGKVRNDPGIQYEEAEPPKRTTRPVISRKTETDVDKTSMKKRRPQNCPIHGDDHSLQKCRKFRTLPMMSRKKILRDNNMCFKCCDSSHLARDCKAHIRCDICSSTEHNGALHFHSSREQDGGEPPEAPPGKINSKCTAVCGNGFAGKSCAKTILVNVFPSGSRHEMRKVYAIFDDQSSQTLATSKFFDMFGITGKGITYTLSSCSGLVTITGRSTGNFVVEPLLDGTPIHLRRVIECDDIPNSREEIPTPDVALAYPHLSSLQKCIPELDATADIVLLIGRDQTDAHHILDQKIGPSGSPFAQKLSLGLAIIGECCLGRVHKANLFVI